MVVFVVLWNRTALKSKPLNCNFQFSHLSVGILEGRVSTFTGTCSFAEFLPLQQKLNFVASQLD